METGHHIWRPFHRTPMEPRMCNPASSHAKKDNWIVVPSSDDVLLGRGLKYRGHPGNARYNGRFSIPFRWRRSRVVHLQASRLSMHAELVEQNRDRYNATMEAGKKKAILEGIVSSILEKGRFLRCHKSHWTAITSDQALLKTAHAVQYQMRKQIGTVGLATLKGQCGNDSPTLPPIPQQRPVPDDLAVANSEKVLELHCQWMVRANELFWARMGPDARQRLPEGMLAAVPLNPIGETSAAVRASP
jgi:hypothetical protein